MGGNPDKFGFSSDQVLSVDYVPTKLVPLKDLSSGTFSGYVEGNRAYENKAWFLDAHEGKLEGSLSVDSPGLPLNGAGYTNGDVNFLSAFNDNKVYLEELGITVETHGADMVEVFKVMTGSTGNYIPPGKKSATSGFIYDAVGYTGTDSVAFGGMTY
jgi:hypothetical protein